MCQKKKTDREIKIFYVESHKIEHMGNAFVCSIFLPIFLERVIKKPLIVCYWGNLLLSVERAADGSRFIFYFLR